jgi:antibiotic biosynthesis monooxygenase (ABM) superfamily enzyme
MWLVSLFAIYPLVVAFQALLVPSIKTWPLLLRSAILPLMLLTLMTFVVMPVVTRDSADHAAGLRSRIP